MNLKSHQVNIPVNKANYKKSIFRSACKKVIRFNQEIH